MKNKTIVIIGGGAGGLELASRLGRKMGKKQRAKIILIDKNRTHIWKPLLHEVATGSLDPHLDGVAYSAHAAKQGFQFIFGEFIGLDPEKQHIALAEQQDEHGQVVLPERTVNYDQLVIAIGSVCNDFSTPGVKQHCFFLDSHQQANRFQHTLLNNFTRVHQALDKAEQKKEDKQKSAELNDIENAHLTRSAALNIAIVGGGATGVELSAELYHVTSQLRSYGLPHMDAQRLNINLIEAGPRILPALPERISINATKELEKLGVKVLTQTRIQSAQEKGFITQNNELIEADIMLWSAGVKVPDFIRDLDIFTLTSNNQIQVKDTLQSLEYDNIYVLGDACAFKQTDGSWVPPRAQSAHQMASCVAKNIIAEYKSRPLTQFHYSDHGSLVNLSKYTAFGNLMGNLSKNTLFVEGLLARLMYVSLYRMHQNAIHGPFKTLALWIAEKMMRVVRPNMKLH